MLLTIYGRHGVDFDSIQVAQSNIMLAIALMCTLSAACVIR